MPDGPDQETLKALAAKHGPLEWAEIEVDHPRGDDMSVRVILRDPKHGDWEAIQEARKKGEQDEANFVCLRNLIVWPEDRASVMRKLKDAPLGVAAVIDKKKVLDFFGAQTVVTLEPISIDGP